jgi:preprotein translocase subunit SecE
LEEFEMADVTKRTDDAEGAEAPAARRTSPVEFFKQVRREAKKVTWPSWKETWLTTMMVFIMVGLTMVFFAIVDSTLQYGETYLIGARRFF